MLALESLYVKQLCEPDYWIEKHDYILMLHKLRLQFSHRAQVELSWNDEMLELCTFCPLSKAMKEDSNSNTLPVQARPRVIGNSIRFLSFSFSH